MAETSHNSDRSVDVPMLLFENLAQPVCSSPLQSSRLHDHRNTNNIPSICQPWAKLRAIRPQLGKHAAYPKLIHVNSTHCMPTWIIHFLITNDCHLVGLIGDWLIDCILLIPTQDTRALISSRFPNMEIKHDCLFFCFTYYMIMLCFQVNYGWLSLIEQVIVDALKGLKSHLWKQKSLLTLNSLKYDSRVISDDC